MTFNVSNDGNAKQPREIDELTNILSFNGECPFKTQEQVRTSAGDNFLSFEVKDPEQNEYSNSEIPSQESSAKKGDVEGSMYKIARRLRTKTRTKHDSRVKVPLNRVIYQHLASSHYLFRLDYILTPVLHTLLSLFRTKNMVKLHICKLLRILRFLAFMKCI